MTENCPKQTQHIPLTQPKIEPVDPGAGNTGRARAEEFRLQTLTHSDQLTPLSFKDSHRIGWSDQLNPFRSAKHH